MVYGWFYQRLFVIQLYYLGYWILVIVFGYIQYLYDILYRTVYSVDLKIFCLYNKVVIKHNILLQIDLVVLKISFRSDFLSYALC